MDKNTGTSGEKMPVFIALLRGINVGGKNRIKMADLQRVLESAGLTRVETYIQSGNVLFESDENEKALREKIETEIEKNAGISTVVVLRTAEELKQLVQNCPFSAREIEDAETLNTEGESLYVSLFTQTPSQESIERLRTYQSESDEFRVRKRDVFLLLRHSIRNSKLANHLQELGKPSTVRNWKTMKELYELAKVRG